MFYSCVWPSFGDEAALKIRPSLVDPYTLPAWLRTPPLSPSSTTNVAEPEPGPGVDEPSTLSSSASSASSATLDGSDPSLLSEARAESPLSTPFSPLKPELVSAARRIHRLLVGLPRSLSFSGSARRRDGRLVNSTQASKASRPRKSRAANVLLLRYLFLVARESPLPETSVEAPELDLTSPYIVDGIFLELLPSVLLSMLFVAQRASPLEHLCTSLYLEIAREKDRMRDVTTGLVHLTSLPLPAILLTFCLRSSCHLARWFILKAIHYGAVGISLFTVQQGGLLHVTLAVSGLDIFHSGQLDLVTVFVGYFENGCGEEAFYRKQLVDHPDMNTPPVLLEAQMNTSEKCQGSVGEVNSREATESHEAHVNSQERVEGQGHLEKRSVSPKVSEESRTRRRVQRGDKPTINNDARKLVNEGGVTKNDGRRPNKLRKPRKPFSRPVSPRPPRPLSPRPLSSRPLSPRPSSSRPLSPRPRSPRPVSPVAPQLATYKVIRLNIQFAPLRLPDDNVPPVPASVVPAHATPQRRGMASAEERAERKAVMAGFKAAGRKWKGKLKGKGRGMGMSRFARMSAETRVREAAARSRPTSPMAGASRASVGGISQRLGEPVVNANDSTPAKKQKVKWGKYVRKLSSQG